MAVTIDKPQLLDRVEGLTAALQRLPQTEPIQKAVYHSQRLHMALRASHNEAVRFAAFTVKKILRDHASEVPPAVVQQVQDIAAALEAMGMDLSK